MCKIVFVKAAERSYDCSDRGELARAIGGSPVYSAGAGNSEFDCLCGLDATKTAQAHNLELLSEPDDWITRFATKG